MSLKAFHVLFVAVSLALASGSGAWFLRRAREHGGEGYGTLGWASLAVAAALAVYGLWFLRKLRRWDEDAARRKTNPLHDAARVAGAGRGPRV